MLGSIPALAVLLETFRPCFTAPSSRMARAPWNFRGRASWCRVECPSPISFFPLAPEHRLPACVHVTRRSRVLVKNGESREFRRTGRRWTTTPDQRGRRWVWGSARSASLFHGGASRQDAGCVLIERVGEPLERLWRADSMEALLSPQEASSGPAQHHLSGLPVRDAA